MALHSALTGSNLHEPKGADGANSGEVYVADGAGSGSWSQLAAASISGLNNKNMIWLAVDTPDLSGSDSVFVPCPLAGDIVKVVSVLQGAITTTDASFRLAISGTPVTDSTVTIAQSGSAAGDVDTAVPTAANTVTADSAIEVESLGTGTDSEIAKILIAIDVS